ncbi:MAG: hypothetical protein HUU15_05470 [Candidatus Brocadiae bacterium]|nr:hypothetical protein [Candidatus Brocadiia bacterium]
MNRCLWATALLISIAALQARAGDEPRRAAPAEGVPRAERLAWKTAEGVEYEYTVPKSYSRERGATLLVMLHGSNLDRRWSLANFEVGKFRRDDIIVSPDGTTPNGSGGFNFMGERADAEKIAALIRSLQKAFRVERVYLYGHSQGAFFCFYFMGEFPALVDAICPHAGGLWIGSKLPKETKEKPIALLHARADAVVPLENSEGARDHLVKQGYRNVRLEILEDANEQTGHWPRPDKTEPLLAWCDSLTATGPASQLRSAAAQITGDEPAIGRALDLAKRAKAGAAKLKKEEREKIEAEARAITEAAAAFVAAQVDALTPATPVKAPFAYGDWTLHFLTAQRWCEGVEEWKAFEKGLAAEQAKHEKAAQPLQAVLEKAEKAGAAADAFKLAFRIWRDSWFSRDAARAVAGKLSGWAGAPANGVADADVQAYREEAGRRAALDEAGWRRCEETRAAAVKGIREKHPGVFGEAGE